jgi:hypothetical protein
LNAPRNAGIQELRQRNHQEVNSNMLNPHFSSVAGGKHADDLVDNSTSVKDSFPGHVEEEEVGRGSRPLNAETCEHLRCGIRPNTHENDRMIRTS